MESSDELAKKHRVFAIRYDLIRTIKKPERFPVGGWYGLVKTTNKLKKGLCKAEMLVQRPINNQTWLGRWNLTWSICSLKFV
jgi:hypothetical protein